MAEPSDSSRVVEGRVVDLESRVARIEAGLETLTNSVIDLKEIMRTEGNARRQSFDDLGLRLDAKTNDIAVQLEAKTKPATNVILQVLGIVVTLVVVMGTLIGAWISRSETDALRWRTSIEERLQRRADHEETRFIQSEDRTTSKFVQLDESVQREMRLLDEAIQREMRLLDEQLALRLSNAEKNIDQMERWSKERQADSLRSNTEQAERIDSLQRQVDLLVSRLSQKQSEQSSELARRGEWMRKLERELGEITERVGRKP